MIKCNMSESEEILADYLSATDRLVLVTEEFKVGSETLKSELQKLADEIFSAGRRYESKLTDPEGSTFFESLLDSGVFEVVLADDVISCSKDLASRLVGKQPDLESKKHTSEGSWSKDSAGFWMWTAS